MAQQPFYDTAIILSQQINPNGTLRDQTLARTDRGIELYTTKSTRTLTMSGGPAQQKSEGIETRHANAMRRYAEERGVSHNDIYCEAMSLDAVGQAVFSRTLVVEPNNWESLVVVAHEYHLARVQAIFAKVFGRDFNISYRGVAPKILHNGDPENEARSLRTFVDTFSDIKDGDIATIVQRLFERHGIYNK